MIRTNESRGGFTLIELLVVIAIIGLLASTVLASLNATRQDARDTAIKQQLRALATIVELHRNATGSYNLQLSWTGNTGGSSPNCSSETFIGPYAEDFRKICQGIHNNILVPNNTILHIGVHTTYFSAQTHYSLMTLLNSGDFYCISNSGKTYEGPPHPTTGPLYGTYNNWGGAGCFANP